MAVHFSLDYGWLTIGKCKVTGKTVISASFSIVSLPSGPVTVSVTVNVPKFV
jgi:hypothetical protein